MQRTITISTDVFAAIWARRQHGEETEDQILARELGCKPEHDSPAADREPLGSGGVYDVRNEVHFPRGFRVLRNYKRKEYTAIAGDGVWVREDTGKSYPTLNQLNASITAGNENVWNGNWKYQAHDGTLRPISELRP